MPTATAPGRRARPVLPWLCLAAALSCVALPAAAQSGGLDVLVVEADGETPAAGVVVELTSDRGLIAPTAVRTGPDGSASFPVLAAGSGYAVEASRPGARVKRIGGLSVSAGESARVRVVLDEGPSARVEVSAGGDVVDLETGGTTTRLSEAFVDDLPVTGRFYQNVLTLAPGVNDADGDGNPNVHGGRTRDFRAEVGGISNVDPLTGQWLSFINPDSIEDIQVVSTGAGAEFGRAQGGFARVIQKQGSNDFETTVGLIYRTSKADGNGATDLDDAFVPDFKWVQPSAQVSGPIVRDRLWFRASHEWIDGDEPSNLFDRVFVSGRDQEIHSDRLTFQASPRNKLGFEFRRDKLALDGLGVDSATSPMTGYELETGGDLYAFTWTAPQSANLLVDSLVSWQDSGQDITPAGVANNGCAFFSRFNGLQRGRCANSATGLTQGTFPESSTDDRQRLTVRSQATMFRPRWLGASHRVTFGLQVENERYRRELRRTPDMTARVELEEVFPCPTGGSDPCLWRVMYVSARVSVPEESAARATGTSWGAWIEDTLRPTANLSVRLGLRVDREEINARGNMPFDPAAEAARFDELVAGSLPPSLAFLESFTAYPDVRSFHETLAQQVRMPVDLVPLSSGTRQSEFWYNQLRKDDIRLENTYLSPRLSIGWDPFGDGRTKLSASAGRYYDSIFLAVPLLESEPVTANIFLRGLRSLFDFRAYTVRELQNGVSPAIGSQQVDRNLSAPYQDEYTLGFERELWPETVLRATWIRRRYRDQLQDVDINHATGDKGRCLVAPGVGYPTVAPAPGTGELIDDATGEIYMDTDPGLGDGIVDDCSGRIEQVLVDGEYMPVPRPDGLDDVYLLNPGWGEILLVGNFNRADYEAFVLELIRRQYRGVELQASYTWSEATGDAEDFTQILGNERNLTEDEAGFLSYDQTHVVRVTGTSVLPHGTRIGGTLRWESGLPWSIVESRDTVFSVPPGYLNIGQSDAKFRRRYPTGQRNDQRNPGGWTLDLMLVKEFTIARRAQTRLSLEVFNVFNEDTIRFTEELDGIAVGERKFGRRYQFGLRLGF